MKSLRFKFLMSFSIPMILTFSIMLIVMHTQVKQVNRGLTQDLSQQIIDAKAEKIGEWLYQRVGELKVLSENPMVMRMNLEELKMYMKQFQKSHVKEFESFGISDLKGHKWVSQDVFIDVSERFYFQQMIEEERKFFISNPMNSLSNGVPIVVIIHEVRNEKGQRVGFVDGAVKLSKLAEIAAEVKMEDGVGWLSDGKGSIFAEIRKNKKDANADTLDQKGYENADEAIKNMIYSKKGIFTLENKDDSFSQLIHSTIPYTNNWSLGIIISEDLIYAKTNKLLLIIMAFGGSLLLGSIIIAVLFSKSIVNPIRYLQRLMNRAENGQLEVRYDGKEQDEIDQLGKSFNSMIEKIQLLMKHNSEEQIAKRKAEIRALQAQINPHFLYNTMDTIKWMAREQGAYDVAEMTKALTKLFQISLSKGREVITMKEEIMHIKQYLYIQKVRYEDKLNYYIDCDETLNVESIIKLVLQPIVENAIYHGIKPKEGSGKLWIKCKKEGKNMSLRILNDGVSLEKKELLKLRENLKNMKRTEGATGYGLMNIQERIKLLYGDSYGIQVYRRQEGGTEVKVTLPLLGGEEIC